MLYLLFFEWREIDDETCCHREQLGTGPDPISTVVVGW
jgi:hypothetical protein